MKIDAHIHVAADSSSAIEVMDTHGLKFLNIAVAYGDDWRDRYHRPFASLARDDPRHFAWCTSFDLPTLPDEDFAKRTIESLEQDFAHGAVACKVWKNIGMELKDEAGRFVQIDHPVFEPILDHLEHTGRTLIAHLGEPLACWLPLDPGNPHYGYYSQNLEWHLHGRSDVPSHGEIIAARDRVLERHPKLKFVGAHLGSLEYDVDELARRFSLYPNLSVDVSARLGDLMNQDPEKVRQFFIKFADRLLFGTDIVMLKPFSGLSETNAAAQIQELEETYAAWFQYFETCRPTSWVGQSSTGIALPGPVLDRFYRENAIRCFPGIENP